MACGGGWELHTKTFVPDQRPSLSEAPVKVQAKSFSDVPPIFPVPLARNVMGCLERGGQKCEPLRGEQ